MNTNLKGGNALVRFLLSHGEKIGMLGILACSGMIIWSALGVDHLSEQQTPNDLTQELKAADQKVKASTYQNYPEDEKIVSKPLNKDEAIIKPIAKSNFQNSQYGYNRSILDPVSLRTDPVLFGPEDLEANGDYGLWASADPEIIRRKTLAFMKEKARKEKEKKEKKEKEERDRASPDGNDANQGTDFKRATQDPSDRSNTNARQKWPVFRRRDMGAQLGDFEEITARSWVTVLARIPVEQQYLQYDDALQMARGYDPATDIPVYGGYIVERAEITGSGQTEWKALPMVTVKRITKEIQTYPVDLSDVIDPRVQHPVLTHPLPPLILREWDNRVSHSSMPLAAELDPNEGYDERDSEADREEGSDEVDIFGDPINGVADPRSARRGIPGQRSPRGVGSRRASSVRGGGGMRGGFGGMQGGFGGEFGGQFGGGGGFRGGRGGGSLGAGSGTTLDTTFTWDQETSHLLLRFFDHTVDAGHRYRYRVRLILKDVNKRIEEKYLDKSVTVRLSAGGKSYRLTDWSKPSGIASVPLPARVYLMSAKLAKEGNFADEAELELLVKALNTDPAAEIAMSKEFIRGSVINLHDSLKVVWHPPQRNAEELFEIKHSDKFSIKFSIRTGITLLDFQGGEKLSRKNRDLFSPTRALLMDPAGKLFVQSELDDEKEVAEYQWELKQDSKDQRGGGYNSRGVRGGF